MKQPYKVGDKVRMFSKTSKNDFLKKEVFTVKRIYKAVSQTGWCMDVVIDECPHCGRSEKRVLGHDSAWFRKA